MSSSQCRGDNCFSLSSSVPDVQHETVVSSQMTLHDDDSLIIGSENVMAPSEEHSETFWVISLDSMNPLLLARSMGSVFGSSD